MARKPSKPSRQALEALEAAQEVAYDAWDASGARRRQLAEKALALSPLCADAHAILAHAAPDAAAALPIWRAAVAAGEAALGPAGFAEMEGEFWGWLETRPYMRAMSGLAHTLADLGEMGEAIALGRRMLVLNPGDNQGMRYALLGWLAASASDAETGELLAAYPGEGGAIWPWTGTLLAFRREGAGPAAAQALQAAMAANAHVAPLLTGRKRMPKRQPALVGWGDPSEAQEVVQQIGAAWAATPGAVAWLAGSVPAPGRRPASKAH